MKRIVSLVLVSMLLLGLCACEAGPTLVATAPTGNNAASENPTSAEEKTFKLGDCVELKDVVVTFVSVAESTGSEFNKPEEGNVYILCEFEIVNNSKEDITVSSIMSFEAYCDDYACDYSLGALMEKGNKDQLDGSVAAGKKMKGVIGYEVPTDWAELEIQYTLDMFSNDKIVFVATNN